MKHKFLQPNALLDELRKTYVSNGKLIIAYDFDNTIHPSGKISAEEGEEVIQLLKRWAPYATFICYTSNIDIMKVYRFIIKKRGCRMHYILFKCYKNITKILYFDYIR